MTDQSQKPDALVSLPEEEFVKLQGMKESDIREALRQGEKQRKAVQEAGIPTVTLPHMLFR